METNFAEVEHRAIEYLNHKQWSNAFFCFDQLLENAVAKSLPSERFVGYLLGRSQCSLELKKYDDVIHDCRHIISMLTDDENAYSSRVRRNLVNALSALKRYSEAEQAALEWVVRSDNSSEAKKMLDTVRLVWSMSKEDIPTPVQTLEDQLNQINEDLLFGDRLDSWIATGVKEQSRRNRKHPVELIDDEKVSSQIYEPSGSENNGVQNFERSSQFFERFNGQENGGTYSSIPKHNGESFDLRTNYQSKTTEVFQEPRKDKQTELKFPQKNEMRYSCTYCGISFHLENQLRAHCATENHQTVIMSDEGRDWKWRPPPRGFSSECYTLCEAFSEGEGTENACKYGAQCVEAHGVEELTEWKERFEYRRMKLQRASENKLYGKSYTEQLLERWVQSTNPEKIMRESLDCVVESHDCDLVTTVESKTSNREWTFVLETSSSLQAVALLQDTYRNHFSLKHILVDNGLQQVAFDMEPPNDQEWVSQAQHPVSQSVSSKLRHQIKVYFTTNIYGTFRQAVVFDFGLGPVLVKHLCVDVIPVTDCGKVKEIHRELILSSMERWNLTNSNIVEFQSSIGPTVVQDDREREQKLLLSYPSPCPSTFSLTHTTISEKKLTRNNYRARIHELLYVEELARYEQVARYNLSAKLQLASCYLLSPSGVAASTAKYSHNNELFALLQLGTDVSEDTSAGRLILNNCTTVYLCPSKDSKSSDEKRTVHEAQIEDKGKNVIYLRLSANTVTGLGLKAESNIKFDVQFQLNRIPYCEWHYAIDHIADFKIIFPDTFLEPIIPWSPKRQWVDIIDKKLNVKQREAVIAITTPTKICLPPILIIGPFGTGKTYTLAQAIKQTLLQDNTRILVCTHSNSAADLYIKDYLHPYVEDGHTEAKPLRIYYHKRWVSTVHSTVQKYCILDQNGSFRLPTLEEILNYRVIVVTLSISMFLSSVGLKKGHFTHILLDEAAQAMECEAIMPLALANTDTRIVLAGDHMQLSPEIFSKFAKERNLHVSLLERLYDHYPGQFACKILLCENYRAHEAIIHFTSELFYEQKLVSKGNQPQHDSLYPLTFFTTRGEDIQDSNSTAFYNNAEVYEVVERVSELRKNWPIAWGAFDEHSIGIMTPYSDQVFRIRSELRKRRMGGISVERVLNVQGKQFRAIFLSTVRTRRTCLSNNTGGGEKANNGNGINKLGMDDMDYGFLSNSKLLNTAITRAQSLVAVVGDPVALCSIGRCRKVWERFIQICDENHSLNGITWIHLRNLLDNLELKKTYVLNPLAPEFVPRRYQQESYIKIPQSLATFNAAIPPPPIRFSQPPPLFSSPIFPFPLYIPSISQPPPPAFISLRQPIINPSQMWPLGPLTSTAPNLFPRPLLQPPIQKPNEEEIRPPPGLVPPRNPGLVHLVQNGHTDLQYMQNTAGVTPVNLPSPNMIVPNANLMGLQDQFNKMNISSIQPFAMQHPSLVPPFNIRTMVDANNKHAETITTQQTLRNNDRSMLEGMLPHNMSIEEMMSSQTKQVEWLKFLTDNGGTLMGQKFIELLRSQSQFKKSTVQQPTPLQQPPPNLSLPMNVPPPEIGNRVPDDLLNILIQQTQKHQINHNGFGNSSQGVPHLDGGGGTSEDMYKPLSNQFALGQQQTTIDQIDRTPLYKRQAQPNGNIMLPINGERRQALSPQYQGMSTYADACRQSPMVEERKNSVDTQFANDSQCNSAFYNFFN